jgi:hypothetical protein
MPLDEAYGWFAYWETIGSRSDRGAMVEREAAATLHTEYDRLRALAGEAEPDEMEEHFLDANERLGEALTEIGMALGLPTPSARITWGRAEILARWASIRAGIEGVTSINDDPMVCAPPPRHEGAIRLLKATVADVPAGGSAPGIDWKAAYESTVGPAARLQYVQEELDRMRPVAAPAAAWQEKRLNLGHPPPHPTTGHDESTSIPEARVLYDAVRAYRAGGSAPHQGATTDVTRLLARCDALDADVALSELVPGRGLALLDTGEIRALLGAGETTEETHG